MYKKSVQGWLKHLDFMILDVVCLWISFTLAFGMRHGSLNVFANSLYRDMMWSLALMDIVVIFFFDSLKNVLKRGFYREFTFKQTRVGKNGKLFQMYKFRSMYMDAEERKAELMKENRVQDGMMFKLDFDPRIIGSKKLPDGTIKKGVGNFIRDWSLDEFPQFLNVLKGVGGIIEPTEKKLDFTGFSLA